MQRIVRVRRINSPETCRQRRRERHPAQEHSQPLMRGGGAGGAREMPPTRSSTSPWENSHPATTICFTSGTGTSAPANCSNIELSPLHFSALSNRTSLRSRGLSGHVGQLLSPALHSDESQLAAFDRVEQQERGASTSSPSSLRAAGISKPCSSTNAIRSAFVVQQQLVQHSSADRQPQGRFMQGNGVEWSLPSAVEPAARSASGSGN